VHCFKILCNISEDDVLELTQSLQGKGPKDPKRDNTAFFAKVSLPSVTQKEPNDPSQVRAAFFARHSLQSTGLPSAIARAILDVLANRPDGYLDEDARTVCGAYLSMNSSNTVDGWASDQDLDSAGKGSGKGSGKGKRKTDNGQANDVYDTIYKQHPQWKSVLELERLCKPSRALLLRVALRGYLPDDVFAKAVVVRRWTTYSEKCCVDAVREHRKRFPARYPCSVCLHPFLSAYDLRKHLPCSSGNDHRPKFKWVRRDAFLPLHNVLLDRCEKLTKFPTVSRDYMTVPVENLKGSLSDKLSKFTV